MRARGRRPIIRAPLDENMRQTVSGSESERASEGRGKKREIPGADFEGGEEVMLMLCLHLSSLSPSVCFSTALSSPPHPLFVKAPFCFSLLYFSKR